MKSAKIYDIELVESYTETLRIIPVGKTRTYKLVGTAYANFQNAKSRFKKQGIDYNFRINRDKTQIAITRLN
jgi:hypothetical protein